MNAFLALLGLMIGFMACVLMVATTESVTIVRETPDGRKFVKTGSQMYWLIQDQQTHGEAGK